MKMAFWMRIAAGALLGLIGLVALWLTLGITWLTATAAALLAPIGFLGSFFIASADRPEEGYEQVLFDRPNTLVSALMILAFAGAGIGTGFLGGHLGGPPSPEANVRALNNAYIATADSWTKATARGADLVPIKEATALKLTSLREESDRIAAELEGLPEGDEKTYLSAANDALAFAIDSLNGCVGKSQQTCVDARLKASDAAGALQRYAMLGEA